MTLVLCARHKRPEDTSQYCFVNQSGEHVAPRDCRCLLVPDGKKFAKYSPGPDQKRDYASVAMPRAEFLEQMKKRFGKLNPDCPIQDPHEPIDPRVRPAAATKTVGAK